MIILTKVKINKTKISIKNLQKRNYTNFLKGFFNMSKGTLIFSTSMIKFIFQYRETLLIVYNSLKVINGLSLFNKGIRTARVAEVGTGTKSVLRESTIPLGFFEKTLGPDNFAKVVGDITENSKIISETNPTNLFTGFKLPSFLNFNNIPAEVKSEIPLLLEDIELLPKMGQPPLEQDYSKITTPVGQYVGFATILVSLGTPVDLVFGGGITAGGYYLLKYLQSNEADIISLMDGKIISGIGIGLLSIIGLKAVAVTLILGGSVICIRSIYRKISSWFFGS